MKIYIAGHRGMVGGAILRRLEARRAAGEDLDLITRTHAGLDLTDQAAVRAFMAAARPDVVILAAAKVGGIHANNTYPAEFIHANLMIAANRILGYALVLLQKQYHVSNRLRKLIEALEAAAKKQEQPAKGGRN